MPGFRTMWSAARDMDILVRGSVTTQDVMDAQEMVRRAIQSERPVDRVQVKLADYHGSEVGGCCVAQVSLECSNRLVRGQRDADTVAGAVELVAEDLPVRLRRLDRHLAAGASEPPSFDWETWDNRAPRTILPMAGLHPHARRLVRHKACRLAAQNADAAALTMDLRDYDFHLFVADSSAQDAVIYRAEPTGYRVAAAAPALLDGAAGRVPVVIDPGALPVLTLPEAIRAIEASTAPILSFVTVRTGRGAVVYRRFDGHLGVVTAVW